MLRHVRSQSARAQRPYGGLRRAPHPRVRNQVTGSYVGYLLLARARGLGTPGARLGWAHVTEGAVAGARSESGGRTWSWSAICARTSRPISSIATTQTTAAMMAVSAMSSPGRGAHATTARTRA